MATGDNQIETASNNQPATRQADVVPELNQTVTVTQAWRGPMPDPESLARYEQIVPGAAERLLTVFEGQVAHRHSMESRLSRRRDWGLALAFIVTVLIVATGAWLIYLDHDWAGAAVIAIHVVGLAAVFITGASAGARVRSPMIEKLTTMT